MSIIDNAQLKQPPAAYRPVAMWFLNGDLTDDELRRQVRAMAEGGVGGVQMAARTGLKAPYLSERWFDVVRLVLDEARQHGMDVWLADEYPYPSGAGGGEVILRHPEYRAWHMRATRLLAQPGEDVRAVAPGKVLLRACAVPVAGGVARWEDHVPLDGYVGLWQREQVLFQPSKVYLTTRRYMTNDPRPTLQWRAPGTPSVRSERWEVWLIAAAEIERYKFFGAYVDLCNPDAVRFFLETTYQRYLERLGPERFGHLAGFFVDESHPQNWSWRLPDFFRQRCGYDLLPNLPALWTDVGSRTAKVRYDYMQSITELFVQSFHRPLAHWCHEHGVTLSLEVGSTRNVVQRHADVPGIDPGHDKAGTPLDEILARELPNFRGNLNFPASLAAQTGKRRVLDELFHSVGWSMTLQDMKAMLDRAAARGANLYAFHGFCYTIGGLKKWDAPPSEFDQNPYWPHFPLLANYAGRLGYALSRGRRVAPIALVDPITSLWAHGEALGAGRDETATRVIAGWAYVMRELLAAQRPYDNVDPLLLAEASAQDGALRLGEAEYRVVILPPVTNLECAAWRKLEEFAAAGGTVIACGSLPYEEIEPESDVIERCAVYGGGEQREGAEAQRVAVTWSGNFARLRTAGTLAGGPSGEWAAGAAGALLELLDTLVPADLRLIPAAGAAARRAFLLTQRREGDEDLFFIANDSMVEHECEVALRARDGRPLAVTRLDLETGQAEPLSQVRSPKPAVERSEGSVVRSLGQDEWRVRLRFPRHGAHLLVVRHGAASASGSATVPAAPAAVAAVAIDLEGEWRCALETENVLRLDRFRFIATDAGATHDDDAAQLETAVTALAQPGVPVVEPKPLVNTLQDLGRAGSAWPIGVEAVPVFGAPPALRLKLPAAVWYATSFEVEHVSPGTTLCLESDALQGEWAVWVNGQRVPAEAFVARRRWDVGNREAGVAALLRPGRNEILVRVHPSESWDGLVDALYLLGDFGVTHDDEGMPHLTPRPVSVRWDDLFGNNSARGGYPYYAGTLHLTKTVPCDSPEGDAIVRLPDEPLMFAGVAQLSINGRALGTRAWAPYAWRVPAGVLGAKANEVTLSVTNTLVGQLEGKRYDPVQRQPVPIVEATRGAPA